MCYIYYIAVQDGLWCKTQLVNHVEFTSELSDTKTFLPEEIFKIETIKSP